MGLYIGVVELVHNRFANNSFVNFKPLAEIQGQQIEELSQTDRLRLLPDSPKGNIFLGFDNALDQDVRDILTKNALLIFEFELDDLEDNFQAGGIRNQTGYKVSAAEMLQSGKLRPLDGLDQVYYAVYAEDIIEGDFRSDSLVFINFYGIYKGCQVLVEQEDGFYAGPFEVDFRSHDSSYYIRPNIENGLLRGYRKSSLKPSTLKSGYRGSQNPEWRLALLKKNSESGLIDVISDENLIDALWETVDTGATTDGLVNISDLRKSIANGNISAFSDPSLPADVVQARVASAHRLLDAEIQNDEVLGELAGFVCSLLIRFKDSGSVQAWIQALIDQNPDLLNQFQNTRIMNQRFQVRQEALEALNAQIKALEGEKNFLEQAVSALNQQRNEIDQAAIEAKKQALLEQEQQYARLQEKIEELEALHAGHLTLVQLDQKKQALENGIDQQKERIADLTRQENSLRQAVGAQQSAFQQGLDNVQEKMVNLPIDGFVASRMQVAAAQWENTQLVTRHDELVSTVNGLSASRLAPRELVAYLYESVKAFRPEYDKNTIINIAICMTQSFLTVFSGEPGCGKTSICDIFGKVLGLSSLDHLIGDGNFNGEAVNRYLPVSVERGWTSKRDFIGYYNPLTKSFDKSSRRVFDALHQLSTEKQRGLSQLPYVILLDEANLSPMEYYWSDFMNLCDNLSSTSSVNLGEDFIFSIPETLHFVATINNDHTTENLSPRLKDRAWIITLPQYADSALETHESPIPTQLISWADLRNAFIVDASHCAMTQEVSKCYNDIVKRFREQRISISPRIDRAIKCYWQVASQYFENDENQISAEIVALDYAIAQRILPKILGNGEAFESWLRQLQADCRKNNLRMSETIVEDIILRGNQQMKYYQFFN